MTTKDETNRAGATGEHAVVSQFRPNDQVVFAEEPRLPYTIRAIGERFAVVTRPMTEQDREDFEHIGEPVPVYTIIDFERWVRGPHDWVFNPYDFYSDEGCSDLLRDLESDKAHISARRGRAIPVVLASDPTESD